jgi:magnesium-transporting ATPase (P-type)
MIYTLKILFSLATICILGCLIHFFYMVLIKSEEFFFFSSNLKGSFGKIIYGITVIIGTIVFGYSGAYNLLKWFPIHSIFRYIIAGLFGLLSLTVPFAIGRYAGHRVSKTIYHTRAKELERLVTSDPKRLTLLQKEFEKKIQSANDDITIEIYHPLLRIIDQKLRQ